MSDIDPARALDGLLALVRVAVATGHTPAPEVTALARHLHQATLQPRAAASEVGNTSEPSETIDDVRNWGTPDEAGSVVGLSGRRVRQLCGQGEVVHRLVHGGRYLVDVGDLQRHLRGST